MYCLLECILTGCHIRSRATAWHSNIRCGHPKWWLNHCRGSHRCGSPSQGKRTMSQMKQADRKKRSGGGGRMGIFLSLLFISLGFLNRLCTGIPSALLNPLNQRSISSRHTQITFGQLCEPSGMQTSCCVMLPTDCPL